MKRPSRGLMEEPYNYSQYAHSLATPERPHSRMSAPEPLPLPFQRTIVSRNQLQSTPPSDSPPTITKPSNDFYSTSKDLPVHPHSAKGSAKRQSNSGILKPAVMRKTLSASMDIGDPSLYGGGIPWKGKAQVAPLHRRASMEGAMPPIGWSSQTQFSNQRSASRQGMIDMQPLIITNGDNTERTLLEHHMSIDNIDDVRRGSPSHVPRKPIDMIPSDDSPQVLAKKSSTRTSSAKHMQHPPLSHLNSQYSEMSISAKNLSTGALNGLSELPSIEAQPIKVRPNHFSYNIITH